MHWILSVLLQLSVFIAYWVVWFVWKCRKGLAPFWYGLALWAIGKYAGPYFFAWWVPSAVTCTLAGAIFFFGPRLAEPSRRLRLYMNWRAVDDGTPGLLARDAERLFTALLLLASGAYLSYLYQHGPSEELTTILQIGIFAFGLPWWHHHRFRTRKPVNKYAMRWRRISDSDVPELKAWRDSKVVKVTGSRQHPVLIVRLAKGRTIKSVGSTGRSVAGAHGLRPGAVTVLADPSTEARVQVRIVPRDPFKTALLHPCPPVGSLFLPDRPNVGMGKFEDATDVLYKLLQHLLVVGQSGSGKSVWLESLAAYLLSYRDAAIVAADLASGATFDVWSDAFLLPVATNYQQAESLCERVFREILYREQLLSLRKKMGHLIDVLPTSEEFPAIFFFIDEFPDFVKEGGAAIITLLERIGAKGRKVNVWLVLGAQNPTQKDVGSTELRGQLTGIVGLGVNESQNRVLWGSLANEGWNSTQLTIGTFLLRDKDPLHREPRVAKGLWLPPEKRLEVIRDASALDRVSTLNETSRRVLTGASEPVRVGGGDGGTVTGEMWVDDTVPQVEARKPANTSAEQDEAVYSILPASGGIGPSDIMKETGLSRDITNRTLRRLAKAGKAENIGHGKWIRNAE